MFLSMFSILQILWKSSFRRIIILNAFYCCSSQTLFEHFFASVFVDKTFVFISQFKTMPQAKRSTCSFLKKILLMCID